MIKKILVSIVSAVLISSVFAAPVLARPEGGLTVLENSAEAEFPQSINFTLTAESSVDITDIRLHYTVDHESFARVTSEVYIEFTPYTFVNIEGDLDMRKTGGLPPGTVIKYWWTLEDSDGNRTETVPVDVLFDDPRHDWQVLSEGQITMYWYEGDRSFADALMSAAQDGLELLHRNIGVHLSNPIEIYIYANSRDLQNAMIFPQEWTGGVAYPGYSTIAIGIDPGYLSWGMRSIVHELTHLVVHQMTDNPYLDLPVWLDEGLAMYMEGPLEDSFVYYLGKAIENDALISVKSLASPFSAYADLSYLSYAQSYSLVHYLISSYGQEKMLELLTVFSQGSGYDDAFEKVYGFDIEGLDKKWNDYIDNSPEQEPKAPAVEATSGLSGAFHQQTGRS